MTQTSIEPPNPAVLHLEAKPGAASEARAFIRSIMHEHPRIDDALLSISELVTNAVRHGRSADGLEVLIDRRSSTIRVSVHQRPGSVHIDGRRSQGVGGLGLMIVEKVSDAWGVDNHSGVWFEIRD